MLTLSKEHGVNPTIATCWWCGEGKNEIILTGAAGVKMAKQMGDPSGRMPMNTVFDMDPCDNCQGYQKLGIMFVAIENEDVEKFASAQKLHGHFIPRRTGPMCVITEEAAQRLPIEPPELLEGIIQKRCCMLPQEVYAAMGFPQEDIDDMEEQT